ncbi:hypothetical protein MKW94_020329 [Papaver nudicaule]|uniref:Transmembrane protein n=1 Tax=Papaver nudicaule TaxID=74823 RepID=A0AA41W211_PAPNU|nr:hypothetical protein [Papaver nudicaule]
MDAIQKIALPIVGIVAVAAVTFYAVSFNEIREEDKENDGAFLSSLSSRARRARKKADKQNKRN